MKRYLPIAIIVCVGAAALASGAYLYRAKRAEMDRVFAGGARSGPGDSIDQKTSHIRGNKDAKVTLEEFGDFQCPPCSILATSLAHIEHDYGDKLRVIFHQFPLPMHAHAAEAARAAEAAGLQGRFWEMHDLLYQNQLVWSNAAKVDDIFQQYARGLGLEVDRFQRDCTSEAVEKRIAANHQSGEARGVTSTPTVFINGHNIPPMSTSEVGLRIAIDAALRGEPLPSTPTPTLTPIK